MRARAAPLPQVESLSLVSGSCLALPVKHIRELRRSLYIDYLHFVIAFLFSPQLEILVNLQPLRLTSGMIVTLCTGILRFATTYSLSI